MPVLSVLFVTALSNAPIVREWFPHAPELAVIFAVVVIFLMLIFQINKKGWKIIGRSLNYFWRILTHPWSLTDEIHALKEKYRHEENPLEITFYMQNDDLYRGHFQMFFLNIQNHSSRIRFTEEIQLTSMPFEIKEWEFPEYIRKNERWGENENGSLHIPIPAESVKTLFILVKKGYIDNCEWIIATIVDDDKKQLSGIKVFHPDFI